QPLPPRQPLAPLMERFEAHSRHCLPCRTAHGRIRTWRPRLLILAALLPLLTLALAALPASAAPTWLPLAGLAAGLLALAAERRLATWQRGLERGSGEPPRNRS
ncbi:MAG: cell death suppressor protein Lls1, partial [Cyanobacteriota bacterium]